MVEYFRRSFLVLEYLGNREGVPGGGESAMQKWSGMYKELEINRIMMFEKFKGLCSRSSHR